MTPLDRYLSSIREKGYQEDPSQRQAAEHFQRLFEALQSHSSSKPGFLESLRHKLAGSPRRTPQGIYLWGGVGRGKTWLMDIFFETLPFENKTRLHFHHFMQRVHRELGQFKGHRNPLRMVGQAFATQTQVLCLDEFHVSDITDAMILYGLLEALLYRGVTLVATSNVPPNELYKDGLQRERFLPAIELIKSHTRQVNVDNNIDYRLRLLEKADTYYTPAGSSTEPQLKQRFEQLAPCTPQFNKPLTINKRPILCRACADDVVWFDFTALCDGPRATADYIEIARCFHTVILSDVPAMDESQDDKAQRFIHLIDEFYDRSVKLLMSADAEPNKLYRGQQLAFAFQRTASRLEEMRTHDYLAKPHKP